MLKFEQTTHFVVHRLELRTINKKLHKMTEEKPSPFDDSYVGDGPKAYMSVGRSQGYNPIPPELPDYCETVLDCAVLYGNSSLGAMFGWDFSRSCEFWEGGAGLCENDRSHTVLHKRLKMIGLDGSDSALKYSLSMNIIDQGILQDFEDEMSHDTRIALEQADVWILQQCLSYMPLDHLHAWMKAFLQDRARPKRFIYDFNPYFDTVRDMTPQALLKDVSGWKLSFEKFYAYRQKTDEEYEISKANGRDMVVYHYVVDFEEIKM